MKHEINTDIIKQSINYYGIDTQSTVCMEECAELIQVISKLKRGKNIDTKNLSEEMADVLICIELLKEMYHISDLQIDTWIEKKQKREEERMNG